MSTPGKAPFDLSRLLAPAWEDADDLVTIVDAQTGLLVYVNAKCIKALGYPVEELLGHRFPSGSEKADLDLARLRDLTGSQRAQAFEIELRSRAGEPILVEVIPSIVEHEGRRYVTSVLRDVKRRKELEARLKATEDRMRRAMQASRTMLYDIDLDHPGEAAVYGVSGLLGLPDDAARQGRSLWQERVHPEDAATFESAIRDQLATGERLWIDYRLRHADGHWLWVHEEGEVVSESGRARRIVGTITDISERMDYEQALRASESRFRATFENAAVGVSHLTIDGRWIAVNGKLCEITGYTRGELLGRSWQELTVPADVEADVKWQTALLAGDVPSYVVEKRYRRKDGSIIWVAVNVSLARRADGQPDYLISVARDISGAKRAEEALHASRDTFRHLVENSPFGVYVIDADFRLTSVSAGARKVFANVSPLIGRDFAEVLLQIWPERFAAEAIERFRHTLVSGESFRSASTVERRRDVDAVEAYDWRIERIVMPDGRFGVVCHFYDLSERQQHEEQVRRLLREVNHRSRNLLAIVQAIARSTTDHNRGDFLPRFIDRLQSLSVSQDLLVRNDWQGVRLGDLVEQQLAAGHEHADPRIEVSGAELFISPAAAQNLGMALHELAANALRHGALAQSQGRIKVAWRVDRSEPMATFNMSWIEESPVKVMPPDRAGFGSRMIGRLTETGLSAKVTIEYSPAGFRWFLTAPLADMIADRD